MCFRKSSLFQHNYTHTKGYNGEIKSYSPFRVTHGRVASRHDYGKGPS